jgi:hypothetical protein
MRGGVPCDQLVELRLVALVLLQEPTLVPLRLLVVRNELALADLPNLHLHATLARPVQPQPLLQLLRQISLPFVA